MLTAGSGSGHHINQSSLRQQQQAQGMWSHLPATRQLQVQVLMPAAALLRVKTSSSLTAAAVNQIVSQMTSIMVHL
jgi:hypothetical protein